MGLMMGWDGHAAPYQKQVIFVGWAMPNWSNIGLDQSKTQQDKPVPFAR